MNYRIQQSCNIVSNDEIHWYLQDLAKMPVLLLKEEQDVVQRIAADPHSREPDDARKLLIEANFRLVVRLALRYLPFGLELADLIQEGNLALVKAAQQFDPQRSQHFRLFARQRVIWALHRLVETHLRERHLLDEEEMEPIRPLSAQALKALLRNALDEQAVLFDLPEERFISLDSLLAEIDLDQLYYDNRSCRHDYLVDESREVDPDETYLQQERGFWIAIALQCLKVRERQILTHRYLLDRSHTLEETGRHFHITRELARQYEERGLRKLRHPCASRHLRSLL